MGRGWDQAKSPLYRNAFFLMASTVVGGLFGVVFQYALTHLYLNSPDLGFAVTLFYDISFIAVVAVFGLNTGIVRFLPESDSKVSLVNTCLTIVGLGALLLALAFVALIGVLEPDFDFVLANPVYPVVIVIAALSVTFAPILDQTGLAMRRADLTFWRNTTTSILKIVFVVVFAFFASTQGRLGIFLALAVPFGIATAVEGLVFLPRALPGYRPRLGRHFASVRPIVGFSLGVYAAGVVSAAGTLLLPSVIIAVIGASSGASLVSYYYIAATLVSLLAVIPGAAFASFFAEASQRNAQRHSDERRAVTLSLVLLVPAIVLLWILAPWLLDIYVGPSYAAGALGPLHILIFSAVASFFGGLLTTRALVRKKIRSLIAAAIIGTGVTLGLAIPLLAWYGLAGFCVGVVIGDFAPIPYLWIVARHSFLSEEAPPLAPVEI